MTDSGLGLFEAFGIEIEYMVVDAASLDVRPAVDELFHAMEGDYVTDVERGAVAWSNELARHVAEVKTNGPASSLAGLGKLFQGGVGEINAVLEGLEARLLPGGMHPWMDPRRELELWPHEGNEIYAIYDRIFDCRTHGWANVQSTHINLPFANDREFGRLHAAIRLVLPLVPAIAASSPLAGGRATGLLDTRLEHYRHHADRVPALVGNVIPERVFSIDEYREYLLPGIYRAVGPFDSGGVLRHEWINARGCIARFDRMAIEIRLADVQECPAADIAVAAAVTAAVRRLVGEAAVGLRAQQGWDEKRLSALLDTTIRDADEAVIDDNGYLECFGFPEKGRAKARDVWQHQLEAAASDGESLEEWSTELGVLLGQGCLARRILRALDGETSRERMHEVYGQLADCLNRGEPFEPGR